MEITSKATASECQTSSLLLFTSDMALVWLMGDSDETLAKRLCYRTGLGKEGGYGGFSGKINKLSCQRVVFEGGMVW